jgi:hypothetical protein
MRLRAQSVERQARSHRIRRSIRRGGWVVVSRKSRGSRHRLSPVMRSRPGVRLPCESRRGGLQIPVGSRGQESPVGDRRGPQWPGRGDHSYSASIRPLLGTESGHPYDLQREPGRQTHTCGATDLRSPEPSSTAGSPNETATGGALSPTPSKGGPRRALAG